MVNRTVIGFLLLLLIQGCAKIMSPTGGPRDVHPPEYLSATPENRALNFSGNQINISFNEYIQLKDQTREIIISPPMKEKPVIRVREKSVRITFNEELLPSTTYTINFGKSLSDLNEGNILPDFEYVFSTGNVIDSLSVTGKVTDAFTHEPDKEKEGSLLIMLYENLADSAPLVEIPRYYGKVNQHGLFAVNNIRADTFRIVALKDGNNNMKYDPGLEAIAFADSFLIISPENVTPQVFIKDTVKIITPATVSVRGSRRDTTGVADTLIAPGRRLNAINVSLYSFIEEESRVLVTSRNRESPEKISFTFNRPLYDSLEVIPVNFSSDSAWYLPVISKNNDTLTYWITDTLVAGMDTLRLRLTYTTTDSAGLPVPKSDTIRLRKPAVSAGRGGVGRRSHESDEAAKRSELSITTNVRNRGVLELNSPLVFTALRPVKSLEADSIEFLLIKDTLSIPTPFTVVRDTVFPLRFTVNVNWDEETQYKIFLKPGAVNDIYGSTNDSTEIRFSTRPANYYGRILLNFSAYIYPMIIQLTNEKGAVLRSAVANKAGVIVFDFLPPGRYSFRAVYDANNNGKWDTGHYLKRRQPEKTFLSGKPEQLRSNWDWEPSWTITEN